jgi:hypothetical protein
MAHRNDSQAAYGDQSFVYEEDEYVDASRLCRKPRHATKPRDVYIVADTSSAMEGEGKIQLARMGLRALYKALSPEERIEISTSSDRAERILRRMEKGELEEIALERILDGLGAKGENRVMENMLERVAEVDDRTDREVTVVVLAGRSRCYQRPSAT